MASSIRMWAMVCLGGAMSCTGLNPDFHASGDETEGKGTATEDTSVSETQGQTSAVGSDSASGTTGGNRPGSTESATGEETGTVACGGQCVDKLGAPWIGPIQPPIAADTAPAACDDGGAGKVVGLVADPAGNLCTCALSLPTCELQIEVWSGTNCAEGGEPAFEGVTDVEAGVCAAVVTVGAESGSGRATSATRYDCVPQTERPPTFDTYLTLCDSDSPLCEDTSSYCLEPRQSLCYWQQGAVACPEGWVAAAQGAYEGFSTCSCQRDAVYADLGCNIDAGVGLDANCGGTDLFGATLGACEMPADGIPAGTYYADVTSAVVDADSPAGECVPVTNAVAPEDPVTVCCNGA